MSQHLLKHSLILFNIVIYFLMFHINKTFFEFPLFLSSPQNIWIIYSPFSPNLLNSVPN